METWFSPHITPLMYFSQIKALFFYNLSNTFTLLYLSILLQRWLIIPLEGPHSWVWDFQIKILPLLLLIIIMTKHFAFFFIQSEGISSESRILNGNIMYGDWRALAKGWRARGEFGLNGIGSWTLNALFTDNGKVWLFDCIVLKALG